jgi:release factor glutamine methyltransferase
MAEATARIGNREQTSAGALYREAVSLLRGAGVESAPLDARVLLAHALDAGSVELIAASDDPVAADRWERFQELVARRMAGEPVARILGRKEFWSRSFVLSPQTLVPRPETETLVESILEVKPQRDAALRILDLGTGSGILLAALLLEYRNAAGVAVDVDSQAAAVARANAEAAGVGDRATFLCGNWGDAIDARFDVVVSNPPYVASGDLAGLQVEVRAHDPAVALDGGADGLDAYRAIVPALDRLLARGGVAVLELGAGQEAAVVEIARHAQIRVNGPARCDLSGHPRALVLGPSV